MSQYPSFGPQDPNSGQPPYGQPPYGQGPYGQPPSYQSPYQAPQGGPEYGYQQPPQGPPLSPLALTSAIVGGISLMVSVPACCCVFLFSPLAIVGGVAAAVTGHIAMVQMDRNPGTMSGKEWAIVGLATGYPAIVISLIWLFLSLLQLAPAFIPAR